MGHEKQVCNLDPTNSEHIDWLVLNRQPLWASFRLHRVAMISVTVHRVVDGSKQVNEPSTTRWAVRNKCHGPPSGWRFKQFSCVSCCQWDPQVCFSRPTEWLTVQNIIIPQISTYRIVSPELFPYAPSFSINRHFWRVSMNNFWDRVTHEMIHDLIKNLSNSRSINSNKYYLKNG